MFINLKENKKIESDNLVHVDDAVNNQVVWRDRNNFAGRRRGD